jgi:hypothetical protein
MTELDLTAKNVVVRLRPVRCLKNDQQNHNEDEKTKRLYDFVRNFDSSGNGDMGKN